MSYTEIEKGIYECDGCKKEMSHEIEHESADIVCNTAGCKYEGIRSTVWMSEAFKEDMRGEEKLERIRQGEE